MKSWNTEIINYWCTRDIEILKLSVVWWWTFTPTPSLQSSYIDFKRLYQSCSHLSCNFVRKREIEVEKLFRAPHLNLEPFALLVMTAFPMWTLLSSKKCWVSVLTRHADSVWHVIGHHCGDLLANPDAEMEEETLQGCTSMRLIYFSMNLLNCSFYFYFLFWSDGQRATKKHEVRRNAHGKRAPVLEK